MKRTKRDILELDKEIRDSLLPFKIELTNIKKRLFELDHSIKNCDSSRTLLFEQEKIDLLCKLKEAKKYDSYCSSIDPVLNEYRRLFENFAISSFVRRTVETNEFRSRKLSLIEQFYSIAIEYSSGILFPQCSDRCECDVSHWIINSEGTKKCGTCGVFFCNTEGMDLFLSKRENKPKGNFSTTINRFMGKTGDVPESVFEVLQREMRNYFIQSTEVTKQHIFSWLKDNGLTEYLEDVNYIHSKITHKPIHDIERYRKTLLEHYDTYHSVYTRIKDKERYSSLRPMYILLKLLQIIGYNCTSEDFRMLKSIEKVKYHDKKHKEVCEITGWKYIPTV